MLFALYFTFIVAMSSGEFWSKLEEMTSCAQDGIVSKYGLIAGEINDERKLYDQIIESDIGKEQLMNRIDTIVKKLDVKIIDLSEITYCWNDITSGISSDIEIFPRQKIATFGRSGDIRIGRLYNSVSRLHFFCFATEKHLYVIDLASLLGMHVTTGTNLIQAVGRKYQSKEGSRRIFKFQKDGKISFQCGEIEFHFNPKACNICNNKRETYRSKVCHHLVGCESCASRLRDCPHCRANLRSLVNDRDDTKTFAPPKREVNSKELARVILAKLYEK